jgi:hypothetical protein
MFSVVFGDASLLVFVRGGLKSWSFSGACYNFSPRFSKRIQKMSDGFSSGENEVDLEGLRRRLRKMKDQELRQFETAAKFMCSPGANNGHAPRQALIVQLEEAQAELERRKTAEPPCKDKAKFGSQAEADAVASYRVSNTPKKSAALRAYKCPECKGWHLAEQT